MQGGDLINDFLSIVEEVMEHPAVEEGIIEELRVKAEGAAVACLLEGGGEILY
jgi:hypothetical protein